MSWYKIARDFSDRNIINHKIIYLKKLGNVLKKMSKMVFQSGTIAKNTSFKIITAKEITSYPDLRDILIEAESIALDSPWRFSSCCETAIDKINKKILTLQKERINFIDNSGNKKTNIKKGLK